MADFVKSSHICELCTLHLPFTLCSQSDSERYLYTYNSDNGEKLQSWSHAGKNLWTINEYFTVK